MARADRDAEFTEYLRARSGWLCRVAYLLCGDWHRADDLAQAAAVRLYRRWNRVSQADNIDGYARRVLVNVYLDEQRTAWSRFTFLHRDTIEREAPALDADASLDLRAALERLAPRQRATVVLRYYCDLSVEQTAEVLGCSPGNVKSQTARALTRLRVLLSPASAIELEGITR
ncbi:SigE family RNA polymerase sigma factor [Catenulispora sp. NF23]|uniref:SigE family RNA polymerase sigma factor n=1 Tax=Catenulispora pinistramenti TaxID=2705254 RepID=A0ABS5KXP1_9ACTN|nr:SigE family RNA polymerase sigma factor [Catenulispora pinistramenti]MBS2536758.1 SigE family RNA polymerase sigma factor [Catenulispora pinistramenti]MBS2550780.1 SigE family RNA polymerase sigma factor [Catenulispora pinistramenti]